MKTRTKIINERIEETDFYVFSKNTETGLLTYSKPFELEESQAVAKAVNKAIKEKYGNARGLREGLSVDEKKASLYNMNTFKGILGSQELARQSNGALRFCTIEEGLLLHKAKMLPSGELMDFGLAVYSLGSPNEGIAKSLVQQAQEKGYSLPILASFPSLELQNTGEEYGITPKLVSEVGLLSSEDASRLLKENNFNIGSSGVQRLGRGRGCGWGADWDFLDYFCGFGADCRVGRVSGEASAKNLQDMVDAQVKKDFDVKESDLQSKLRELKAEKRRVIISVEKILSR